MNLILVTMRGMMITQEVRPILWVRSSPMPLGCTTCTVMCGNGCRIGTIAIMMELLRMAVLGKVVGAPTGSFGAVAGATLLGAAGRRFVTTSTRTTAPAPLVFAFCRKRSYFLLYHFTTYIEMLRSSNYNSPKTGRTQAAQVEALH